LNRSIIVPRRAVLCRGISGDGEMQNNVAKAQQPWMLVILPWKNTRSRYITVTNAQLDIGKWGMRFLFSSAA
jgi:hypothetical protein